MAYNTDLMIEIRNQITNHPETHNQKSWGSRTDCGTTHCIAGWAIVLSGVELHWQDCGDAVEVDCTAGGRCPGRVAGDLLGLDWGEWGQLFYEDYSDDALELLDRMIEAGKNGERVELH